MTNFKAALEILRNAEVNFVVVGAYAAVLHGSSQLTRDLDICYERTSQNIKRLVTALSSCNPRLRGAPSNVPFLFDERTVSHGMNFILETDFGDLDLLGELSGLGQFPDVIRDAISIELFGQPCRVASLDAIIQSKRAA
ncbi:MAG TPA: hypothetical protein VFK06_05340 [Candidatus Angelobacter sp.]|nr:hypothetical protein [Candidatus Angelobacter sp.]